MENLEKWPEEMNEDLVQNSVMNEQFVKNSVMSEELVQNRTLHLSTPSKRKFGKVRKVGKVRTVTRKS